MELMLLRVFQQQIQLQCQAIMLSVYDLNGAMMTKDITHVWIAIQNLLGAAANVSKALWGQGGRLAEQREPLRRSIQVDDSSPLRAVVMRNHFEHFDEKLDEWWKDSTQHNHIDMNIGPREMIQGAAEIDMFRQFDPTTGNVMFWGKRFNLNEVIAEVGRILPIVSAEAKKPHWEPPPSSEGSGQPHLPS